MQVGYRAVAQSADWAEPVRGSSGAPLWGKRGWCRGYERDEEREQGRVSGAKVAAHRLQPWCEAELSIVSELQVA
jgi:hypothetical protein